MAMKRITWLLLALAVAVLVASPILAAEKAAKGRKAKGGSDALRGEYAIMASECGLTDQQKTDLKAKVKARKDAQKAWMDANGDKYKALREAYAKAKEAGDKDAMKKARDELKGLGTDARKAEADSMTAIYAVLTPEQKAKWKAFQTYRTLMRRYKRLNPTEEQTAKIREAAAAASKGLGAVAGDDKESRKKQGEIQKELHKTIEETILTAEQREALQKKPEKKPAKKKAEKAER
jgi:Spy/CpxP family protein refolding chaperone